MAKAKSTRNHEDPCETNVTALGLGPAVATINAYLGASAAQQRLFFGAVDQQSNGAIMALATTAESVHKILGIES